jgi:hypothetical protein
MACLSVKGVLYDFLGKTENEDKYSIYCHAFKYIKFYSCINPVFCSCEKVKLTINTEKRTFSVYCRAAGEIESMGAILQFLRSEAVFEPEATQAMSAAFDSACRALNLSDDAAREREAVAVRIIELARRGERDPQRLSQSVLRDAGGA